MGINFTWNGKFEGEQTASWAYSGFNQFRERLAAELGMKLPQFWNNSKLKDDIVPLLNHSDCDGELSAKDCAKVAPRLRELINDWENGDYDKDMGLLLARNMEQAATKDSPLIFT